jgi:hypothetical protein
MGGVGGLVGYVGNAEIFNCHAVMDITLYAECEIAGGLIGYAANSYIHKCYSTGSILDMGEPVESFAIMVGGLIGIMGNISEIDNSVLENCYSEVSIGPLAVGYYLGGLVGYCATEISNCYATGTIAIEMSNCVGGLIGFVHSYGEPM